jgi:hypothetical protein
MPAPQPDAVFGPHLLRTGRVIRVDEHACEVWSHGEVSSAGFDAMFPSPPVERVRPGHLVAIATGLDGTDLVVWRWYDAVVLGTEDGRFGSAVGAGARRGHRPTAGVVRGAGPGVASICVGRPSGSRVVGRRQCLRCPAQRQRRTGRC